MEENVVNNVETFSEQMQPVAEQAIQVAETVQAIQPVVDNVPNITIKELPKQIIDLKKFTIKDGMVAGGLTLGGAAIAEGVRWLIKHRPIKKFFNNVKKIGEYLKSDGNNPQQTQNAQQNQQPQAEQPAPAPQNNVVATDPAPQQVNQ